MGWQLLKRNIKPATVAARQAPPPLLPGQAFTPTQPCSSKRHTTGRSIELERILQALGEERAHVVLYSERGRGKTTLANLVVETLRQSGVMVARYTCDASSSFDAVLRGLARDLPRALMAAAPSNPDEAGCESALPQQRLRPADVVALPSRLTCRSLVFVVDEFDRIEDPETGTLLADTIKQLSDHAVPLLFMVVGVSENLEQILGQHPSIERNVAAVPLPLLTEAEVAALITKGAEACGFTLDPAVKRQAVALARGSPHTAQLVGLRLVQSAARRNTSLVSSPDLADAVARLLATTQRQTVMFYDAVTAQGTAPGVVRGLQDLAFAALDTLGRIHVLPSSRGVILADGAAISASAWARLLEMRAVWPDGASPYLHTHRALMHYVLLLTIPAAEIMLSEASDGIGGASDGVTHLAATGR